MTTYNMQIQLHNDEPFSWKKKIAQSKRVIRNIFDRRAKIYVVQINTPTFSTHPVKRILITDLDLDELV